jgi:DNA polymerase-3 subunit delta
MTPEQFLSKLAKQPPAPVYLFLGLEGYQRRVCKQALLDKILPGDARAEGFTQVDLEETSIPDVLDDACSLSLFATDRVIWVTAAEAALPRRLTAPDGEDDGSAKGGPGAMLASYVKRPTPGTVLVFECSRFDFSGDDKTKLDRVAKFYSAIPGVVEFRPFTPESARVLGEDLARRHKLKLGRQELSFLLEILGGDASRLATELEKLSLFAGQNRPITLDDIRALVPNASQSTIFTLVNALGRGDRAGALRSLDVLVRDGEYLPLALTFLATQFRLALAAREAGIRNSQQAFAYFTKQGVRMWRDRAEQLMNTANAFSPEQLRRTIELIYRADKGLRDTRPDDRTVMEMLVVELTTGMRSA